MNKVYALITFAALLLAGCASSSVVVGNTRAPIDATQVKVYLHPPKKFEEIALVEASSKASFAIGDQAKMNVVINRLKEEAAKLGANGVLLGEAGEQYAGSTGSAYGTTTRNGNYAYSNANGSTSAIFRKAGKGLAIFVTEE